MAKILDYESVKSILEDEIEKCSCLAFKESSGERERLLRELLNKIEMISQNVNEIRIVPHAHWYWFGFDAQPGVGMWHCSLCNGSSRNKKRYCPDCGAIMKNYQEDDE